MSKKKIIDIDAEFDSVVFDEHSINRSTARKIISETTNFNDKMSKIATRRNLEYQKNHQTGIDRRENNIDYQIQRAEKNRKQATDSNYRKNLKIGVATRFATNKGYLVCPAGIFLRQPEAADALNVAVSTIQRRIKSLPKEYYYISKEEYTRLTGKEL